MGPFADAELIALAILEPVAWSVIRTAPKFDPPVVVVQRVGGSDNGITDLALMSVTCHGATRAEAVSMAEACRQRILAAPMNEFAGCLVDTASTVTPAAEVPDPRSDVRTVPALYQLGMRRPRPTQEG